MKKPSCTCLASAVLACVLSVTIQVEAFDSLKLALDDANQKITAAQEKEIPRQLLVADRAALVDAASDVETALEKKGFTKKDVRAALNYTWFDLRCGKDRHKPDQSLSKEVVLLSLLDRAKVTVRSNPDDATVFIDGVQQPRNTETVVWPKSGDRDFVAAKGKMFAKKSLRLEAQKTYTVELPLTSMPDPRRLLRN